MPELDLRQVALSCARAVVRFGQAEAAETIYTQMEFVRNQTLLGKLPIPMILYCPNCGNKHIDKPKPEDGWDNPPHRSHACQFCKMIWRPADVCTTGVEAIETQGQADDLPLEKIAQVRAVANKRRPRGVW